MSLDLKPEVERIVRERADAAGVSVDDLLSRTFAVGGGAGDATQRVQELLAQWQAEDRTPEAPHDGPDGAPAGHLPFARWRELDATMTEAEREAEDRLWEDVQRGIDETRAALGMRRLSP